MPAYAATTLDTYSRVTPGVRKEAANRFEKPWAKLKYKLENQLVSQTHCRQ